MRKKLEKNERLGQGHLGSQMHDGPSASRHQEPVAMSKDLGRGVCSEQGFGATWERDSEVTSMEVEMDSGIFQEGGGTEGVDSVISVGKGNPSDSAGKGDVSDSVILEKEGDVEALVLEREQKAVRDFEIASDVDPVSFILPD